MTSFRAFSRTQTPLSPTVCSNAMQMCAHATNKS